MDSIKDTVTSIIIDLKKKHKEGDQEKLFPLLKKSLTPTQMRHIKPVSFHGGILRLNVDSSVWLYQLNLEKQQIIDNIRSQLDNFKDIHFRLGDIK